MIIFVCVGVTYSGEYDVCDVTLSVHLMVVYTLFTIILRQNQVLNKI
jgi:hypothetical protein